MWSFHVVLSQRTAKKVRDAVKHVANTERISLPCCHP